ncbi:MAG: DUF4129 domain-containing protein [Candidatus Heimdallarchaeota archaeon]|nr:DUF4129 domain-containing protein [Candidatus Heimdallarchaeota archaeon]
MGIFDFFTNLRKTHDTGKVTDQAIAGVKAAAQASNYNQASMKAFYALEEVGKAFAEIQREPHITAREYSQLLVEDGKVTDEDVEPIIHNFEIAKYSPEEVTFDDYRSVEASLETVVRKFKKPDRTASKDRAMKGKKSRRKPKRRATGKKRRRRS